MKTITSLHNPFIKTILKLQEKSRERKKQGMFIVEGKRELSLVQEGKYDIKTILFVENLISKKEIQNNYPEVSDIIEINQELYEKLAYRESTEGIIGLVRIKDFSLEKISFSSASPLVLVLEGIEKPGNIGAILRTADAANIDAVFIADPKTDMFNPNIIRSSVGCLFTNQIAVAKSEQIIDYLNQNNIRIFSATLQNSNAYHLEDYTKASAIVVGTEATGLSTLWREKAFQNINIPMQGAIDSMNVSVACAIITFEAKRQRGF